MRGGRRTALRVSVIAAPLAIAAVLYATYEYSFCILLENDCHVLGRAESCTALASTLRFCAIAYGVGVAFAMIAGVAFVLARRWDEMKPREG
jgi:ABC-type nitrate/sulfonate/bicarbonate transport system permease component